jgi:hypothetical protein
MRSWLRHWQATDAIPTDHVGVCGPWGSQPVRADEPRCEEAQRILLKHTEFAINLRRSRDDWLKEREQRSQQPAQQQQTPALISLSQQQHQQDHIII